MKRPTLEYRLFNFTGWKSYLEMESAINDWAKLGWCVHIAFNEYLLFVRIAGESNEQEGRQS